ncbi:MAG: formate dehydrogenase accessory sulfurtransferase FdhD [Ignisphaera sp.]
MDSYSTTKIVRVSLSGYEEIDDIVAEEIEGRVYVDGVEVFRIQTSPHMLKYLGIGYAVTHGFDLTEARTIVENNNVLLFYAKPFAREVDECSTDLKIKVRSRDILKMFEEASKSAKLFTMTGCFHFSALFTLDGVLIEIVEDISRLGSLLKLIGKAYESGVDFRKTVVVLSSRAGSEMVKAITAMGIPIAVFRGAPTRKAIEIARSCNMALIGHVRGDRFNVYSGFELVEL